MKRSKLLGLQILRGLAAWFVVFQHINQAYFDWKPPLKFMEIFNYGGFGVDIFFVLSGFIMYYSVKHNKKGGISFFIDRFFRVFPVYWFMTIVLVLSAALLPLDSYDTSYTANTLIKSFLLIPSENPNGLGTYPFLYVGWTLAYEMLFYLILSISLLIYKKRAILISTIILCILPIVLGNFLLLGNSNNLLFEFVLGIFIAHSYVFISSTKYFDFILKPIVSIPISLTLIVIFAVGIKVLGYNFKTQLLGASSIIAIFLIIENLIRDKVIFKKLVVLGDISYSTYLIHPIILGWFKILFVSNDSSVIKNLIILVFIYLVYFLSKLSYKHIEVNNEIFSFKEKVKKLKILNIKQSSSTTT